MCQSLTLIRVWRLFADDEVNLCASPLFHIASIGAIAPMVLIGGTTVLLPSGAFERTATCSTAGSRTGDQRVPRAGAVAALCDDASLASRDLSRAARRRRGAPPRPPRPCSRRMAEAFPGAPTWPCSARPRCHRSRACWPARTRCARSVRSGKPVAHGGGPDRRRRHEGRAAQGEVGEIVYRGTGLMAGLLAQPRGDGGGLRRRLVPLR